MEELKHGWKKRISWLVIALIVVFVYKLLDNFSNVQEGIGTFFRILKPFLIGLLISYILYIPCKKIEKAFKKSKTKFMVKKARGLAVITTYIIATLIIIIITTYIYPILRDSAIELFSNLSNYYDTIVNEFDELPENSILKNELIRNKLIELQNINIEKLINDNNDKIVEYGKNIINVFLGIFDVFVSIVVSVYILLQRTSIVNFLRKLCRAIFKQNTYETIDKYFTKANEVFFTFISAQLFDAFLVWILTSIAMMILKVRYAPLLGFLIGLFNLIPYVGAIVAVGISILITLITGGFGKTLIMAIVVIILQQIDANIINPKIIGHSLEISPLLVLIAVTIGGAYFGIVGMFLAVPVAVVIKVMLCDYVDYKNELKNKE